MKNKLIKSLTRKQIREVLSSIDSETNFDKIKMPQLLVLINELSYKEITSALK